MHHSLPVRVRGGLIQIEVTKIVAAVRRYVVANIVEWPLIMRSVKGVEVCLPPARSEQARDCGNAASYSVRGSRMVLIFCSRPVAPTGEVMQPLMTPFIEVNLRDELERDL